MIKKWWRSGALILPVALAAIFAVTAEFSSAKSEATSYPISPAPQWNADGSLAMPKDFREWVFLGAPTTPNALNGGAAAFPEFHNVYTQPSAFKAYRATGKWPEGTMMVKELQLAAKGDQPDGSAAAPSGRGYFPAEANGIDISVKDSAKFPDTKNWGFFTYGHHAIPYAASSKPMDKGSCAACHMAQAHEDMVYVDFYKPILKPFTVK